MTTYTPDQLHDLYMPNPADDVLFLPDLSNGELTMSGILVEHAGYVYCIEQGQGKLYTATCQRTGRVKTRLNPNLWHNRNNGLVTDKALIEALENGVKELQRTNGTGPRPPFVAHNGHYSAPTVRSKGQVTPREKRTNGRASE